MSLFGLTWALLNGQRWAGPATSYPPTMSEKKKHATELRRRIAERTEGKQPEPEAEPTPVTEDPTPEDPPVVPPSDEGYDYPTPGMD